MSHNHSSGTNKTMMWFWFGILIADAWHLWTWGKKMKFRCVSLLSTIYFACNYLQMFAFQHLLGYTFYLSKVQYIFSESFVCFFICHIFKIMVKTFFGGGNEHLGILCFRIFAFKYFWRWYLVYIVWEPIQIILRTPRFPQFETRSGRTRLNVLSRTMLQTKSQIF